MKIVKLTKKNLASVIKQTKSCLEKDGLVVFPSDTVYGLAANALSKTAIQKLYQFKNRPVNQSVAIAVANINSAKQYFRINTVQQSLLETLLPGPFTVVLESRHKVITQLEAENQTLGMRIPDYFFTQALSQSINFPYTATSANLHSKGPHYSVTALLNSLSDKKKQLLDLIIDYGSLPHNQPSTIINLTGNKIAILRQGDYLFKPVLKQKVISVEQTQLLAKQLLEKYLDQADNKALVMILQGDLGAGKTVFTQGLGHHLGINNIVSPTFVVYYEYLTHNPLVRKLYHFDLYQLESPEDFEPLAIDKLLIPGNLLVFEWGEKLGSVFSLIKSRKTLIILIKISELTRNSREFAVYQLS